MSEHLTVAIVGGGIAGLTAALALARRDIDVCVFEQRGADVIDPGAGLQLSPNANHALEALGLGTALAQVASEPREIAIRDGKLGTQLAQYPLGAAARARFGAPYLQLARADLCNVLLSALQATGHADIRYEVHIAHLDPGDPVTLALRSGDTLSADCVVVADGIHSASASALGLADKPKFSGHVAWRSVIAATDLPAPALRPVTTLWTGRGAHAVTYPIADGQALNLLACVEQHEWPETSWTARGPTAALLSDFKGWHRELQVVLAATDAPYRWALHDRAPAQDWSRGRIVAIGDACHPLLPFAAQGAAQAIEDAVLLGQLLTEPHAPQAAFAELQAHREARVARVYTESRERAASYHRHSQLAAGGVLARLLGTASRTAGWAPDSLDWLYGYKLPTENAQESHRMRTHP